MQTKQVPKQNHGAHLRTKWQMRTQSYQQRPKKFFLKGKRKTSPGLIQIPTHVLKLSIKIPRWIVSSAAVKSKSIRTAYSPASLFIRNCKSAGDETKTETTSKNSSIKYKLEFGLKFWGRKGSVIDFFFNERGWITACLNYRGTHPKINSWSLLTYDSML